MPVGAATSRSARWPRRGHHRTSSPSPLQPEFFIDLKTGDTGLDPDWYDKLNRNLPDKYQNLPVLTVRC